MLTTKKMIIIVVLFLLAITGLRLFVLLIQQPPEQLHAAKGVLDLRGRTFPQLHTLALNGEWEFYPNQLIGPNSPLGTGKKLIQVPGAWKHAFNHHKGSFRYGTYKLRILIDDDRNPKLLLRMDEVRTASAVYVNGKLVSREGFPSDSEKQHKARHVPNTVDLPEGSNTIDLLIQVSNHAGDGGITKPVRIGTMESIQRYSLLSMGTQFMLCVILCMHGIYAVMLYLLGPRSKGMIYFSWLIVCAIVSVLTSDDKLLLLWFPMPYEIFSKIAISSYVGVAIFLPPLIDQMFPGNGSPKVIRRFVGFCLAYAMFILLAPTTYTVPSIRLILFPLLLMSVFISGYILRSAIKKKVDVIYILLGCISIAVNVAWVFIKNRASIDMVQYPFDLMIATFCLAAFWFSRFFRESARTKQLADKLQAANQQKDDFLVNTSHEIRNPLHGIMNITQSVLDDNVQPASDDHRRKLELQLTVARRMSLLLDDLLDVTRLKENTIRLQVGSVRVQSVLSGVLEMLRFMLDGKPIRFVVDIANTFPAVKADENKLIQILFNLLHNAIKFTDKGTISVHAALENGMAHVNIRDTGIGMDEETLNRIFQPYEQGSSNMTRASGGLGLGLNICKQLVELHGGTIRVSSSPGQGTVFSFTLPLSDTSDHPEIAESFVPAGQLEAGAAAADRFDQKVLSASTGEETKPKLLAVDDDSINLKILRDVLGAAEYRIMTVTSAAEAIKKLQNEHFDLVISDVMMPHISGYEFTRMIRERFSASELPILLLTARNRSEDIFTGFQAGANDYVTKPVDAWELRSRVRALTELKRSAEERMRMEAAWLQSQIQPHFIFNTLNAIAALGTMDIARMQDLMEEFGNYLRTSFDFHNSAREIPIERELNLVQSYLFIEKERFGDRLQIQWKIDTDTPFLLPPLSIQTLVENAVNHGILQRAVGGTVEIQIAEQTDYLTIGVRDNGVGMSEEKLRQIWDPSNAGKGIGLRNTNRRLKQFYGTGLQIQSTPGHGTEVSFAVPKHKKE